jgi:hypothetical protein
MALLMSTGLTGIFPARRRAGQPRFVNLKYRLYKFDRVLRVIPWHKPGLPQHRLFLKPSR